MLPTRGVGWKYDLPPHDIAPAQREVCLASNLKINRAGHIFIEIPRSSVSVRGISFFGGLIILIYTMVFIVPDIITSLLDDWQSGFEITTIGIMIVTLSTWAFFHCFVWTYDFLAMNPYASIEHAKKSIFTSTGLIAYTPSAARVGG